MNYVEKIDYLDPCEEGREFLAQYDNEQDAWNNCNEPAYKLWYLGKTSGKTGSPERKKFVKCLLDIVSLCKPCVNEQEEQLRQECIKVGYDYCENKATLTELKQARSRLWCNVAAAAAAYAAAAYADAAYYAQKAGVTLEQQLEIINQNYPIMPEL